MKRASMHLKKGLWLQALSICMLLTPAAMSAGRSSSTTTITTNINPGDRNFIAECLHKISTVIEKTEYQLREFFNESNSEKYRIHIDRFGNLLIELEQELIKPLNQKSQHHESFKLAHEILLDLKELLEQLYKTLEQHERSNHFALGTALEKLAREFIDGHFRHNIECKIDNLTIIVETIAAPETNCLKEVIIRLYDNNPLKGKDKWTILRCLKHRLGCR